MNRKSEHTFRVNKTLKSCSGGLTSSELRAGRRCELTRVSSLRTAADFHSVASFQDDCGKNEVFRCDGLRINSKKQTNEKS